MIDFFHHYQLGLFGPGTNLEPNHENIGRLLELSKGTNLVPSNEDVLDLTGKPPFQIKHQLNLISQQRDYKISFEKQRINCSWDKVKIEKDITLQEFIDFFNDKLSKITDEFQIRGNRLFLNCKGFLSEMDEKSMLYIHQRIFNSLPDFFSSPPPVTWSSRNITRLPFKFSGHNESINTILDIGKGRFKLNYDSSVPAGDRIEIGIDINTLPENEAARYSHKDLESFIREAKKITDRINTDLEKVFR